MSEVKIIGDAVKNMPWQEGPAEFFRCTGMEIRRESDYRKKSGEGSSKNLQQRRYAVRRRVHRSIPW